MNDISGNNVLELTEDKEWDTLLFQGVGLSGSERNYTLESWDITGLCIAIVGPEWICLSLVVAVNYSMA